MELAVICLLLMAPLLMPRAAEHSVKGIISHHLIITVGGLYSHGKRYFNPFFHVCCLSIKSPPGGYFFQPLLFLGEGLNRKRTLLGGGGGGRGLFEPAPMWWPTFGT